MSVLKKPLLTEKFSGMNEVGKYCFLVDKSANKIEIKKAVETTYGVTVERVNTMIYQGKKKTKQSKSRVTVGRTSACKKSVVRVSKGDVIDFYSEV